MPSDDSEVIVRRTRKRNEIDYYDAMWKPWPKARGGAVVEFITGPYKGERYEAADVAKAGLYPSTKRESKQCEF